MKRSSWPEGTDALLDEILTDACGEEEQLWALLEGFADGVGLAADAFVIGEPVSVLAIDYDGNSRRGLTALCLRSDGGEYVVTVSDVVFPDGSDGERHVAAYRKWQGLDPLLHSTPPQSLRPKRHKAGGEDIDLSAPVELVVLAPKDKDKAARCRVLGTEREITVRYKQVWEMVPGEIITVRGRKQWTYARHPYLSGEVQSHRLEVQALGLTPLRLRDEWRWDPAEEYWGDEDEPLPQWAEAIIARGPRMSFEMEQVLPGEDPINWDTDPILESNDLRAAGDVPGARKLLVEMLAADLRCLDAHAHLGNLEFAHWPDKALRHYEAGMRIGELSLGAEFDGVLEWGRTDNRPFLRCMHGFGLCLWRIARAQEAGALFERMLWLNPNDNQGVRSLLARMRAGERWEDRGHDW